MKKVRLGKTSLTVSRVGIGGIPIQRPPLEEAIRIVNRALDLDINFIDTSIGYGDSEIRIGKAIKDRRDEVYIATKGSWRSSNDATSSINDSLNRLGVEHIDLWQFHNIRDLQAFAQVISPSGALEAAKNALKSGNIGHLGFSTHNIEVAIKGVSSGLFETVQFPFDFVAPEAADDLVPLAKERNVGFIAMKPFAGGNITNAKLAVKYLLQYENVIPVPGIQRIKEIEEIVEIVNGPWGLEDQDRRTIDEIRKELGSRFCRQCMYCMPCPNGVEIWLLTYMRNLHRLWPRDKFVEGWFADAAETAKKCVKCGSCEPKCPYDLQIREMIDENYNFFQRVKRGEIL